VRRRAPRPVGAALDGVTATLAPATLLAEVQRVWPAAAGDAFAQASEPVSERDGVVTVACASAVWAQELDLLSERVLERLEAELGRRAVRRLRAQARPPSR
jgi:predicted nucleic acid-binding Zn ribbon protein